MARTIGGDMRAAVVQHAAELFAEQGYAGTSLRQVAAASGLTMASVYHYFRTKEALAAEVVSPLLAGVVVAIEVAEAQLKGDQPNGDQPDRDQPDRDRAVVRELLTSFVLALLEDPLAARLMAGDLFMARLGFMADGAAGDVESVRSRLYRQLGGLGALEGPGEVVVTAALGMLLRPLVVHGPDRLREAAPHLIDAATALLA